MARTWIVYWPNNVEPVPRKYQEAVTVDRVLGEHHGAVAAVPAEGARTSDGPQYPSVAPIVKE